MVFRTSLSWIDPSETWGAIPHPETGGSGSNVASGHRVRFLAPKGGWEQGKLGKNASSCSKKQEQK
jgi:hypothetical protein